MVRILRLMLVLAVLVGPTTMFAACSSGGSGGCGGCKGGCVCAPDKNCCEGCRQGTGCTCNR